MEAPKMRSRTLFLLCGLSWFAWALAAAAAEPITPAQFTHPQELIKPGPHEDKWSHIAWRTDLWQARKEAAAAGKPILLWEMDGHPLGCT
jgi:hypothetical protein